MGVVYFSIIPTFEPSRYCKCWIVCFYNSILKLLLLLGHKVLEISHDALFLWCFGNIQWIIILLYLELQRDEEYLREE